MKIKNILRYLALACLGYLLITCLIYRFRHPEMTETQLILNLEKILRLE